MNFSHVWKGLAVVAALFLFSMEASAQLPVRTQSLQLISPGGGTLTQNMPAAGAASYSVTWPATSTHSAPPNADGDEAILIGTYTLATNNWQLRWEESEGFVDGEGLVNHVTWWNPDNNTLDHSDNFEWNGTVLGIGVDQEGTTVAADPAATLLVGDGNAGQVSIAGATATVTVGNTQAGEVIVASATQATINLDGATATATVGGATTAGTLNVGDAAGAASGVIAGATGTLTLGNNAVAPVGGEIIIHDGSANTVTINPGAQTVDVPLTIDQPTTGPLGPATTFYVPPVRNQAGATTTDYLLVSQADGTAAWEVNPFAGLERGVANPDDGVYSYAITGLTVTPDATDVIMVSVIDISGTPTGNILAVTALGANQFTVSAAGPFTGTERIAWIVIPITP